MRNSPHRVFLFSLVTGWSVLANADPTVVHCTTTADAEIAGGDFFKFDVEMYVDHTAVGPVTHITPWETSGSAVCPAMLTEQARVCRESERLGMSPPPSCPGVITALEASANCDHSAFEGMATAGICIRNGQVVMAFEGTGTWNGMPGYTFRINALDSSTDTYAIRITAPDGSIVHEAFGNVVSGDISATVP